jgi:hypothetical protein
MTPDASEQRIDVQQELCLTNSEMQPRPDSREIRQCLALSFLIDRLVAHSHRVTVSLYEPHFRGFRLDGLKLSKQISSGGDLDVRTIAWFGLGQHGALFIVCYHCHGRIIPPVRLFSIFLADKR